MKGRKTNHSSLLGNYVMRLPVPKLGNSQANWSRLATLEGRKLRIHFWLGQRTQRKWTGKKITPPKITKLKKVI